jgi:hypothetical protein
MSALTEFLKKYGKNLGQAAALGGVSAAASFPVAYGMRKTFGSPEDAELQSILKEIKSVKRKQAEALKK